MENKEIAAMLEEAADLMEVAGQDPFRVRSYRNAVRAIENLTERLEGILGDANRKLTEIPSIGKAMASHIEEICRTGKLSVREELAAKYPAVTLDLLRIQGLG
ncbi:MAG: DNA polymerase III, partial [Terriglobia bacterium]